MVDILSNVVSSLCVRRQVFGCGGNITGESGVIGSQGYPGVYPPNTKCVWRITVSSFPLLNESHTFDVQTVTVKRG